MKQKITIPHRVENVNVRSVDADTLFAIAEHYGFPALTISYPDYSKYVATDKTPRAWDEAVCYLQDERPLGTDMLKYAYLKFYDWYAQYRDYNKRAPIMVSSLFNDRTYLVLNEANKKFSGHQNLNPCEYYRLCLMLTLAEKLNFPEITVPYHNINIRGNMESWLDAAKWLYFEEAVVWVIHRLMEMEANGNLFVPRNYKSRQDELTAVRGSDRYILIYNSNGFRVWQQKQLIE